MRKLYTDQPVLRDWSALWPMGGSIVPCSMAMYCGVHALHMNPYVSIHPRATSTRPRCAACALRSIPAIHTDQYGMGGWAISTEFTVGVIGDGRWEAPSRLGRLEPRAAHRAHLLIAARGAVRAGAARRASVLLIFEGEIVEAVVALARLARVMTIMSEGM